MANKTKIEYCDETHNIVTGCLYSCPFCYGRRLANGRLKNHYLGGGGILMAGDPKDPYAPRFWPDRLEAKLPRKASVIFLNDMGDAWGDWVPNHVILQVLDFCRTNIGHAFLHLTKNPKRYEEFKHVIPANCWLGTSINHGTEGRDEILRKAAGRHRKFISFEPLLNNVVANGVKLVDIKWIIIGAQTRPTIQPHTVWVKALLGKAQRSGVPVFMKDNLRLPWINARRKNAPRQDLEDAEKLKLIF